MRTILITGGAGFIGSNFLHYLRVKYPKYRLLVLDLLTYSGNLENFPVEFENRGNLFEFWYGDVCNVSLVERLVSQADSVFHFAAETHVTRSIHDNYHFFRTDVLGTQVVTNAVCKYRNSVERFIHVSTSEVYGTSLTDKMNEEHPLLPMSPYASAKAGADRLVYSYWATYKIPAIIVRPFNNFGPRQHLEKMIPRFITCCLLGLPITVHGDGMASRDWLYVDDTCRALDMILHCKRNLIVGEVLNIGSGCDRSVLEITNGIISRMNVPEKQIVNVEDRPGQVSRHKADIVKIKHLVGWAPSIDFDTGLDNVVTWYCNNRPWWNKQLWTLEPFAFVENIVK